MISIDLSGRTAIVTGGGSGIGEAIANRMAEAGARVMVADLFGDRAGRVAENICAQGGEARSAAANVAEFASVERMYAEVQKAWGAADILVNCAGAWTIKKFMEIDPSEYRKDVDVCLYGTMHCCRVCVPDMMERKYGRIVNIISDSAKIGEPTMSLYSAAKGATAAFTKALAKEVGRHNITVNGVSPGTTRTPGNEDFRAKLDESQLVKSYPLRRLGEPADQANAVLFFASDLSSWITGQILSVSGGYTMV